MHQKRVFFALVLCILLSVALLSPDLQHIPTARAATITVTSTADDLGTVDPMTCSLREAIQAANTDAAFDACPAGTGADIIELSAGATYTLTIIGSSEDANASGDLDITDPDGLIINGNSATIDATGLGDRVLNHHTGTTTLNNLYIRRGSAPDLGGGGIRAEDTGLIILTGVIVLNNQSVADGGGIFSSIPLTIQNSSIVQGNLAGIGASGGGIFTTASVTIDDSTLISNTANSSGGGVYIGSAVTPITLTVRNNSEVTFNSAGAPGGGGIFANGLVSVNLENSDITENDVMGSGNGAGVMLNNGADLTATSGSINENTCLAGCSGGGLFGGANSVIQMTGTAIFQNEVQASGGGMFVTGAGASVTLNSSLCINNTAGNSGGGAYITGGAALNMVGSGMTLNTATNGPGGGIVLGGTGAAILDSVTITNNNAPNDSGGAIYSLGGGALTITGASAISSNTAGAGGGGIYMNTGSLTLTNSTINQNTANTNGGGALLTNNATLNATGTVFDNNTATTGAGGGLYRSPTGGTASLETCTFQANDAGTSGGAIYADATPPFTISRCTISGNTAANTGGGIQASGSAAITLTNSTISGNTAANAGGGVSADVGTSSNFNNVTITNNSGSVGGGVAALGTQTVANTLIAGNTGTASNPDCSGTYTSSGYNLIGNGTGCAGFTDGVNNDHVGTAVTPINPMLGALANNGGSTSTHLPQPGSPAINHGNNGTCISPDQRGITRPLGGVCDIGSVEAPFTNTPPTWTATPPNQAVFVNQTLTLPQSTFTDPDTFQTFTATIDWGDSATGTGTVNYAAGNGTVDWPTHAYTIANIYTATVTISDGTDTDTATFTVTVYPQAVLSKVFDPANIFVGGTSTIIFTITNPAGNPALAALAFTDTLPAGVTAVSGGPGPGMCPFGVLSTAGSTINLTYAEAPAGPSACNVYVTVSSAAVGTYTNDETNISNLSPNLVTTGLTATLTVTEPVATLSKVFAPDTILAGNNTPLTFTLTNPAGNPALTGLAFTDTLPAGVTLAADVTTPQCGGTVTGTAGTAVIGFSGGALLIGPSTCTIDVSVTSAAVGTYTNNAANISGLSTNLVATGLTATLNVTQPIVTLSKVFAPDTILAGNNTPLTFTLTNPAGNPAQSGLAFTDTLPAGVTLAADVTTPQCGGTVTGTAGTAVIGFSGGALLIGPSTCTIDVSVTSAAVGTYTNNETNISGLSANLSAAGLTATLNVTQPVATLSKVFAPDTILAGNNTPLTFTLTNPAGNPAQSGLAFTDTLPAGVTLAADVTTPQCGGTVTGTAGTAVIGFSGGALAIGPSTCTIDVSVTSAAVGTYTNNAANISGLSANLSAAGLTATLNVTQPVATLSKVFVLDVITVGDNSTLTFTITNPAGNPALNGITFTDELPLNVFPISMGANTCGAAVNFSAIGGGAAFIEVTAGAVGAGPATCIIRVTVTSDTPGVYTNDAASISNLSANLDATGLLAVLTVDAPDEARLGKQFTPATIQAGRTASLTFTITNAASAPAQTGLAFTDTLPAGVVVSGVPAASQCGGTVSATATVITFTGGTLVAGQASCSITVTVTGNNPGVYTNDAGNISGLIGLITGANIAATLTITDEPVTPPGDEPSAEDHARAQAPLCALIGGGTNPIVRADVQSGTVTDGSVFCRILAQNGTYILTPAEVGIESVVNLGVIHAVDVFGLRHGGESDTHFNYGVKVCLQGSGRLLYLDATQAPRPVSLLTSTVESGYICAVVPNAGTVVLVP